MIKLHTGQDTNNIDLKISNCQIKTKINTGLANKKPPKQILQFALWRL